MAADITFTPCGSGASDLHFGHTRRNVQARNQAGKGATPQIPIHRIQFPSPPAPPFRPFTCTCNFLSTAARCVQFKVQVPADILEQFRQTQILRACIQVLLA